MKHDKDHQDNLHDVCGSRWDSPDKGKTVSKTKSPSHSTRAASGAAKTHSSKSTGTTSKAKKSTGHTVRKPTTGSADKSNLYNTDEYILVEEIVVVEEDF